MFIIFIQVLWGSLCSNILYIWGLCNYTKGTSRRLNQNLGMLWLIFRHKCVLRTVSKNLKTLKENGTDKEGHNTVILKQIWKNIQYHLVIRTLMFFRKIMWKLKRASVKTHTIFIYLSIYLQLAMKQTNKPKKKRFSVKCYFSVIYVISIIESENSLIK